MIVQSGGNELKLPDFVVIGAAKSGTTSLYFYLRQHPAIFMPADIKEPGFFCFAGMAKPPHPPGNPYPYFWNWVITDDQAYSALFDPAAHGQLLGEATPEYLYLHEKTIANIKRYYGQRASSLKFIVVLRDPVDRAWSHYTMACRDGYESRPFEEAMDPGVIASRIGDGWHPSYDYLGFGFYARSIEAYQEAFGKDHLKVVLTRDLATKPVEVCQDIFRFLGIDDAIQPQVDTIYNASGRLRHPKLHEWLFRQEHFAKSVARQLIPYNSLQRVKHRILKWNSEKVEMPGDMRADLTAQYRSDVEKLSRIVDVDLSSWLQPPKSSAEVRPADELGAVRGLLFHTFRASYDRLARTPLRRVPGMLALSNLILRRIWSGHEISLQGFKMYIDLADPSPAVRRAFQAYIMNRVHEPTTTALFKRLVKPGSVVIDAGANIGYFTLLAAQLTGRTGKVISFEPEPTNCSYLKRNIELNRFDNVVVQQKAVSNVNGSTDLFICTYDSGHHTINRLDGIAAIAHGRAYSEQKVEIETVRLDDIVEQIGLPGVDVIKIDVEGAEVLAAEGMRKLLAQDRLAVFIEYFPLLICKMGNDPEALIDLLLNDYAFKVYVIGSDYDADKEERALIRIDNKKDLDVFLTGGASHVNLLLLHGDWADRGF